MILAISYLFLVSFLNIERGQTWTIYIIYLVQGLGIFVAFSSLRLSLNRKYKPMFLIIITLPLLGSIVSGFFGRKVGVNGAAQPNTYSSIRITTTLELLAYFEVGSNFMYKFKFNSLDTNRNKKFICNKAYYSTSSLRPEGDSNNLESKVFYYNADIDKEKIVKENQNKSGVYRWTCLSTKLTYVGSSVNLGKRLKNYYSYSSLTRSKSMIISKAILKYGYSNFSLEILEYCTPEECIKREQYYLDLLNPEYNILKIAGSTLGYKHTEETLAKFKERKLTSEQLEKLRAHLIIFNQNEKLRSNASERMLKLNEAKAIRVEVTDIRINETTIYKSLRDAAKALNTDLKAMHYNERKQKERNMPVPFKKHYYIKIKRD
jgi:group I intron endonuclease